MQLLDLDIFQLLNMAVDGRRIVAFGAGMGLEIFCGAFRTYGVEKIISFVIDNDHMLSGKCRSVNGKKIRIISFEEAMYVLQDNDVVVITMMYITEALEQLQHRRELKCAFYGFIMDNYSEWNFHNGKSDCEVVKDSRFNIPKIIHYCWFGKGNIPDKYKEWMKSWKKYCPDYEIQEWNEDNYDVYSNQYMAEAYERKKWGFVPDYARLDILYKYGGIYLDTDVELLKNLDSLLEQEAFVGFFDEFRVNLGIGFGSVVQNPFIKEMCNMYNDLHFVRIDGSLNMRTSNWYQTDFLVENGMIQDGSFQQLNHINIYPRNMFAPLNVFNNKLFISDISYGIHHSEFSWGGEKKINERFNYVNIYNALKR